MEAMQAMLESSAATCDNRVMNRAVDDAASVRLNRFLATVERRALLMVRLGGARGADGFDILQEAMLRFVRRYAGRPEAEWRPLFFRVLRNAQVDHHRRESVRSRWRAVLGRSVRESGDADPDSDGMQELADPDGRGPEEQAAQQHFLNALHAALAGLPARQREAFLLRAWEELSVAETAVAMRCSQGSVKTHYSRALTALRGVLQEHAP